jgi:hypothetical protein
MTIYPFTRISKNTRSEIEMEAGLLAPHRGCTSVQVKVAEKVAEGNDE